MAFEPKGTGYPQLIPEDGIFSNSSTAKYPLGMLAMDVNGNEYRYIKAAEALAVGELVTNTVMATWDTTVVTDGAVAVGDTVIHIDTTTSAFTANQYAGYYVGQAVAASKGFLHRIKAHDSVVAATGEVDLILDHAAMEVIADGVALLIYHPYVVELTDAVTENIAGVAIGTITSAYYGFVQVGGVHPGVLCDGSNGTAVVLNESIVPYGTDPGQGQGYATADEAGDMEVANSPLIALEASTVDAGYVPARFTRRC